MEDQKFQRILAQIASQRHTTTENVYKEMKAAMDEAQRTADPATQALWASIPRKGKTLTVEEFVAYIANKAKSVES